MYQFVHGEQCLRWIGGGFGCFSRYYNIHALLSAPACTDIVYVKEL